MEDAWFSQLVSRQPGSTGLAKIAVFSAFDSIAKNLQYGMKIFLWRLMYLRPTFMNTSVTHWIFGDSGQAGRAPIDKAVIALGCRKLGGEGLVTGYPQGRRGGETRRKNRQGLGCRSQST